MVGTSDGNFFLEGTLKKMRNLRGADWNSAGKYYFRSRKTLGLTSCSARSEWIVDTGNGKFFLEKYS